jgi:hypothetical protein
MGVFFICRSYNGVCGGGTKMEKEHGQLFHVSFPLCIFRFVHNSKCILTLSTLVASFITSYIVDL